MFRFGKAADAHTVYEPLPFAGARDFGANLGAKGLHRFGGIKGIVALEHAADTRLTDRECAQNKRPNRNGFVAGHPRTAGQRAGAAGSERDGVGVHCNSALGAPLWRASRSAVYHAPRRAVIRLIFGLKRSGSTIDSRATTSQVQHPNCTKDEKPWPNPNWVLKGSAPVAAPNSTI